MCLVSGFRFQVSGFSVQSSVYLSLRQAVFLAYFLRPRNLASRNRIGIDGFMRSAFQPPFRVGASDKEPALPAMVPYSQAVAKHGNHTLSAVVNGSPGDALIVLWRPSIGGNPEHDHSRRRSRAEASSPRNPISSFAAIVCRCHPRLLCGRRQRCEHPVAAELLSAAEHPQDHLQRLAHQADDRLHAAGAVRLLPSVRVGEELALADQRGEDQLIEHLAPEGPSLFADPVLPGPLPALALADVHPEIPQQLAGMAEVGQRPALGDHPRQLERGGIGNVGQLPALLRLPVGIEDAGAQLQLPPQVPVEILEQLAKALLAHRAHRRRALVQEGRGGGGPDLLQPLKPRRLDERLDLGHELAPGALPDPGRVQPEELADRTARRREDETIFPVQVWKQLAHLVMHMVPDRRNRRALEIVGGVQLAQPLVLVGKLPHLQRLAHPGKGGDDPRVLAVGLAGVVRLDHAGLPDGLTADVGGPAARLARQGQQLPLVAAGRLADDQHPRVAMGLRKLLPRLELTLKDAAAVPDRVHHLEKGSFMANAAVHVDLLLAHIAAYLHEILGLDSCGDGCNGGHRRSPLGCMIGCLLSTTWRRPSMLESTPFSSAALP